jgi:hypothetical protein
VEIDAAAARDRVSLEHIDEFVEIDRQAPQQRRGPSPQPRRQCSNQILVALPAPLAQFGHAPLSQLARSTNVLSQRYEQPITDQLERVTRPGTRAEERHQRLSIRREHGSAKLT